MNTLIFKIIESPVTSLLKFQTLFEFFLTLFIYGTAGSACLSSGAGAECGVRVKLWSLQLPKQALAMSLALKFFYLKMWTFKVVLTTFQLKNAVQKYQIIINGFVILDIILMWHDIWFKDRLFQKEDFQALS